MWVSLLHPYKWLINFFFISTQQRCTTDWLGKIKVNERCWTFNTVPCVLHPPVSWRQSVQPYRLQQSQHGGGHQCVEGLLGLYSAAFCSHCPSDSCLEFPLASKQTCGGAHRRELDIHTEHINIMGWQPGQIYFLTLSFVTILTQKELSWVHFVPHLCCKKVTPISLIKLWQICIKIGKIILWYWTDDAIIKRKANNSITFTRREIVTIMVD